MTFGTAQCRSLPQTLNSLNELCSPYDLNGNPLLKRTSTDIFHLTYDPFQQLTSATSTQKKFTFQYDALGRLLSKTLHDPQETTCEYYIYDGDHEIGAFTSHELKELKVLGKTPVETVGVEIGARHFAPLVDVQGNIRRLIDPKTKVLASRYDFTAFGEEITPHSDLNPWRFASKRADFTLGLIYFGKRFYDPSLGRWLTPDPAGPIDSSNLYQYVFNNPFRYRDPDGQFIIAIPLLHLTWQVLAAALVAAYVNHQLEQQQRHSDNALAQGFYAATQQLVQSLSGTTKYQPGNSTSTWKNTDVYAPDRPLPRDPRTKEPVPESDAPHTELGTKDGTKGKYPQAREFDAQGRPVKDIDFTNHGRPQNHPNPHEHKWEPNTTGGTPRRSPEAEPLTK